MNSLIRKSFPVGPLACNCSIIGDPITKEGIVVDPGGDAELILKTVADLELKIIGIIHTHAHLDHFLAAGDIKAATGAPLCLHKDDKPLWDMAEMQCTMMGMPFKPLPDPDQWLHDDEGLCCCNGLAIHTPGHTPGSMSFWFEEHNLLIAGDTLFRGSIGRTDLPGGDPRLIQKSIQSRLYALDDDALVITGHGPETSIGFEKRSNMFVRAK